VKNVINCLILLYLIGMGQAWAADSLVIFSGRSDKFVKPVAEAFTKETGIKVTLHSAKSTALLNKLKLEGARTEADLYLSNDAGNLQRGADLGLFQAIPAELTSLVGKNYRSENNLWVGLSARARVLVVNKNSPFYGKVNSVLDLAKPELRGHIAVTNSTNESFIAGVTVYQERLGDAKVKSWLQSVKANAENNIFDKHSKIVKSVAQGRVDVGLVNHYYIYRHLDKEANAPVDIVLPDQAADQMGIAWNVAGVAISKHTKQKQNAIKFVRFVLSKKGQKIFADVNREYPTRSGIEVVKEIPKPSTMKVADVAMGKLGKKRNATVDLLQSVDMP